jgi:hypothetical protein
MRYGIAPFSIIRADDREWLRQKVRWHEWLKIRSAEGRNTDKVYIQNKNMKDFLGENNSTAEASIFDPVLCEIIYRWWGPRKGMVLDPFSGGSVRGIVASVMGLDYVGIDVRPEQIEANRVQWKEGPCLKMDLKTPKWICGDSRKVLSNSKEVPKQCDLMFSCPPYGNLIPYSKLPEDLCTLEYDEFREAQAEIIVKACLRLKEDRFAVWVVANFWDRVAKKRQDQVGDSIEAFESAGCKFHTEAVLVTPKGAGALFTGGTFTRGGRRVVNAHQMVLVFVKGNAKKAGENCREGEE